jgi:phosphate transport system protein
MGATQHTVRAFDADLRDLTRMTAETGSRAEQQVIDAVDALITRDCIRGREVVRADILIDAAQREIESKAVATIATRQPMAVDLREVIGALRIANDLERIGDLAKNIGKRAVALNGASMPRQAVRGVVQMTGLAIRLLRDALDSYAERNGKKAVDAWRGDAKIDVMYDGLFRYLLTFTTEHPHAVTLGIHLLFCAKNIERIGDHAASIAESVYYIVNGHAFDREHRKEKTGRESDVPPLPTALPIRSIAAS